MSLNPSPLHLRIGVLGSSMVLAAVIVVSAWSDWNATRETTEALVRGEGEQAGEMLGRAFQDVARPLTDADLREALEQNRARGVVAMLVLDRDCEILASAGDFQLFQPNSPCRPPPSSSGQGRVLGHKRLEPPSGRPPREHPSPRDDISPPGGAPPPDDAPPKDDAPSPGARAPGAPRDPPPELVFEVETHLPEALRARALRSLGLGLTVALSLLLGGAGFWRLSRRSEVREGRKNLERHLATLGEMSAVLAHEIRNPLASLKGNAQLLAEDLEAPQKERAQWVVTEAQRLETLTHSLLQFVRSGTVAREMADPTRILQDAVREIGPEAFEVDVRDAPGTWLLDPLRVHQALSNLLRNALQAEGTHPPRITLGQQDGSLVFEVRDFGTGVPAGQEAAIFEPFHTTRTQGTGLGLGIVRRVAMLHGGTVRVGNHPAGGAVFTLSIPRGTP